MIAVVTGASSGIGRAVAAELAGRGAAVIGFARRFEREVVGDGPAPGEVLEVGLDVADEAAVAARFAEIERVDALVCSAGGGVFAPIDELAVDEVREMLDAHVIGTLLCCRAAVPLMSAGGRVVVIGSIAVTTAFADNAGYAAAKAGQRAVADVLRVEARDAGVRVTYAEVGAVDTPIWDERDGFDRAAMMRPEDVAAAVADAIEGENVAIEHIRIVPPSGAL